MARLADPPGSLLVLRPALPLRSELFNVPAVLSSAHPAGGPLGDIQDLVVPGIDSPSRSFRSLQRGPGSIPAYILALVVIQATLRGDFFLPLCTAHLTHRCRSACTRRSAPVRVFHSTVGHTCTHTRTVCTRERFTSRRRRRMFFSCNIRGRTGEGCRRIAGVTALVRTHLFDPHPAAGDPVLVKLLVEGVGVGPPPHREPALLLGHHRPVGERDRRALLEEPRVGHPPARIPVDQLVDAPVAPARRPLEHGNGELRPPLPADQVQQVRLPPGELAGLAAGRPVEQAVEPGRFPEVIPGGNDAGDPAHVPGLPLHEPEERVRLDQVQKHLRVPPVVPGLEPDPGGERDHHVEPLPAEHLPHRLADQYLGPLLIPVGRDVLVPEEDPCQHEVVLLRGVVDPAGEHPVEDLVVARALDLRHPPHAPLRDGADLPLPVPAHGAVDKRLAKRGGNPLQDLLHLVRERGIVQDDHRARLQRVVVE